MEPVEPQSAETPKTPKDRVVLDADTMVVVDSHIESVRAELGDVVAVSAKQLVNYLMQKRSAPLSWEEMSEIKTRFADRVKLLQTILDRAKTAKKEGRDYSLEDDLKIFETLGVSGHAGPKKVRKKRSPTGESPSVDENQTVLPMTAEATETETNDFDQTQSPNSKKSKSMRKSAQEFDLENSR
jgi:hypothetical protein